MRARLYALIAFLGFLPGLGLAAAWLALQSSARDTAALDRAARDTIYLERINGLISAIEMESRGIYASADRKIAEPFSQRLLPAMVDLRKAAQDWQAEAIASKQSNVLELARQIGQFMNFHAELVRLGKEEGAAAARIFVDNDANRNVRSALNEGLSVLARNYEDDIGNARSRIEMNERKFMTIFAGLAGLAFAVFWAGVLVIRRGLLAPLMGVRTSMLRLAGGELDGSADPPRRGAEICEMMQAIDVFRANLLERRKLNNETKLLSELNDWLQSCNSLDELYEVTAAFLARVLPDCAGSLYIYANSRDVLENTKTWNGGRVTPTMHPEDCWGLRKGRLYTFGENETDFPCAHAGLPGSGKYCCIPILAHGETIGLLHIELRSAGEMQEPAVDCDGTAERKRLAVICAERISLAIANVKLRDQLRDQSIRDPLTGLFNRRYLLETCRREFSRAARMDQDVSLLSIDVDHFKKFNDNHGHDAGDAVLRAVAKCLMTHFRNEDVPCRFGGEEFIVLLPSAGLKNASVRAEQLRAKIEALSVRYLEHTLPKITISIGVSAFPHAGDDPQAILKAADEALYRAKENGRNRVELTLTRDMVEDEPIDLSAHRTAA